MAAGEVLFVVQGPASGEERAALTWLRSVLPARSRVVEASRLAEHLDGASILWWHLDRAQPIPIITQAPQLTSQLREWVSAGGRLWLTLQAASLLFALGLEERLPDRLGRFRWRRTGNEIAALQGERRGLLGFGAHPIFDGLHGGALLLQPRPGSRYPEAVWTAPASGWVVATEWQNLGVDESRRLALEHPLGAGRVLSIGAHLLFGVRSNPFRPLLERFARNCLRYLSAPGTGVPAHWPTLGQREARNIGRFRMGRNLPVPIRLPDSAKAPVLTSDGRSDAQFDLTGQRITLIGREKSGVREIWSPPVRIARDVEAEFTTRAGEDVPESSCVREFRRFPERVERVLTPGSATVLQTIDAGADEVHLRYEVQKGDVGKLLLRFRADLRYAWPHPEGALGRPAAVGLGDGGLAIVDGEGTPRGAVLFDPPPIGLHTAASDGELRIAVHFELATVRTVSATFRRLDRAATSSALGQPVPSEKEKRQPLLAVETPDSSFDEELFWATNGLRAFDLESPAGRGLVAGLGETREGWCSGRLGYAWYFGRDTVWSAFGCLAAGMVQAVRESLRLQARYQQLDGKILHELTPTGVAHFDAADSSPLFLIGLERHYRWTGDRNLLEELWPAAKRTLEFCFSTDKDGDGLIENTGVGHGWSEGGRIYGSDATFYLNACWGAALWATARMAADLGEIPLTGRCSAAFQQVRHRLNSDFFRAERGWFAYGKNRDGSFMEADTIEPAVACIFGLLDAAQVEHFFDQVATDRYTTPWGVRYIARDHPAYHPRGYHYGSVWPLFTGWVAMAEYAYGRAPAAFGHIRSSLALVRQRSLGCIEEVLHGERGEDAGVCPHQLWSHAMTLMPVVEGLVGVDIDIPAGRIALRPRLPVAWSHVRVRHLVVGSGEMDFSVVRAGDRLKVDLERYTGPDDLTLEFRPPGFEKSWRELALR